jgi:hypothetical protein
MIVYPLSGKYSSDFDGFSKLAKLLSDLSPLEFEQIQLDFKKCTWFEANLCAVLGAIINRVQHNLNWVSLINLPQQIEKIFSKNHFLSNFGEIPVNDFYKTTIKYRKYKPAEEILFKKYLDEELLSKEDMPQMSLTIEQKINESIFEIFVNACTHGETESVFSCGQYFPNKKPDPRIDFTIVDLGKTIRKNVSDYLRREVSAENALTWATSERNTTKTGSVPGGLGLKLIQEFLKLNNGEMQIVSDNGFWQLSKNSATFTKQMANRFPGTIVNLDININDKNYYIDSGELNETDIF